MSKFYLQACCTISYYRVATSWCNDATLDFTSATSWCKPCIFTCFLPPPPLPDAPHDAGCAFSVSRRNFTLPKNYIAAIICVTDSVMPLTFGAGDSSSWQQHRSRKSLNGWMKEVFFFSPANLWEFGGLTYGISSGMPCPTHYSPGSLKADSAISRQSNPLFQAQCAEGGGARSEDAEGRACLRFWTSLK